MINKALFSSDSDEWSTPQDLYDKLDTEFHFTLDPCANENNHKCTHFFTKNQDGLKADWGGNKCSATRHIARLQNGLKNAFMKDTRITQQL